MKAYLIDPEERTITAVDIEEGDAHTELASWYEHMRCTIVQAVYPLNAEDDVLLLDEEGKFHPRGFFCCRLWPHEVLTGRALWIGRDDDHHIAPRCSLEYVAAHIVWMVKR